MLLICAYNVYYYMNIFISILPFDTKLFTALIILIKFSVVQCITSYASAKVTRIFTDKK